MGGSEDVLLKMSQPCKNFKVCRGYAYDRHAKHCAKCWKRIIDLQRMKTPLKDIRMAESGHIEFEFENEQ